MPTGAIADLGLDAPPNADRSYEIDSVDGVRVRCGGDVGDGSQGSKACW